MIDAFATRLKLVGYQVRTSGGATVVGEIEGVRPNGVRVHKIPDHPRRAGYLPAEAMATIDDATNTVLLVEGIDRAQVVDAPPPPDEAPDGWRKSDDWWADLLGHYGLFESEGRGSEPFLHADQK
jgi:hypothetical protein